jgi:hypothetical protein
MKNKNRIPLKEEYSFPVPPFLRRHYPVQVPRVFSMRENSQAILASPRANTNITRPVNVVKEKNK